MSYADVILAEPSVQSYWHLDEASGSFVDVVGAVDGTETSTNLRRAQPGLLQSYLTGSVWGDSAEDDGINFGDFYDFSGTASFSAEIWTRPMSNTSEEDFLFAKFDSAGGGGGWAITYSSGGWFFRRWDTGGVFDECNITSIVNGRVHHVVATYDGADMNLYVNAASPDTQASTRSIPNHTVQLAIGHFGGGGSAADAYYDEPAIYNAALSAASVTAHFNAQLAQVMWFAA